MNLPSKLKNAGFFSCMFHIVNPVNIAYIFAKFCCCSFCPRIRIKCLITFVIVKFSENEKNISYLKPTVTHCLQEFG